jgi:hypothetical protein
MERFTAGKRTARYSRAVKAAMTGPAASGAVAVGGASASGTVAMTGPAATARP